MQPRIRARQRTYAVRERSRGPPIHEVRLGSSTDLGPFKRDFGFRPVNGHRQPVGPCPVRANNRLSDPKFANAIRPKEMASKIKSEGSIVLRRSMLCSAPTLCRKVYSAG